MYKQLQGIKWPTKNAVEKPAGHTVGHVDIAPIITPQWMGNVAPTRCHIDRDKGTTTNPTQEGSLANFGIQQGGHCKPQTFD